MIDEETHENKQKNNEPLLVDISNVFSTEIPKIHFPPDYFKNLLKPITEFTSLRDQIVKSMAGVNHFKEMTELFLDSHKRTMDSIRDSIVKAMTFSKDFVESFKKLEDETKIALKDTGWIICPSLMEISVPELSVPVKKYLKGDKGKALSKTIKEFYGSNSEWEMLEKTVNGWGKHKLFTKQRMRIICDSLQAHKDHKYTLSIPSLLPQIEGIISDYIKGKPGKSISMSKSMAKAKKAIEFLDLQGESFEADIFLDFVEKQLYVHTDSLKVSKNRKNLNRHGILHGKYAGYPDCTRSLKCFMILDLLSLFK